MSDAFTVKIRREPEDPPGAAARYTVRFTCRRGRGVLVSTSVCSVREAELRSNGLREELKAAEVLAGEFVFVGFELEQNGKYKLWDGDARQLAALPAGRWALIEARPVDSSPFFALDTDLLDYDRPWMRRRTRRRPLVPVTEPGGSGHRGARGVRRSRDGGGSRCCVVPSLLERTPEPRVVPSWPRWDEQEVLALPEAGLVVAGRELCGRDQAPLGGKGGRVVHHLRQQLHRERGRQAELRLEMARLQAVIAALTGNSSRD